MEHSLRNKVFPINALPSFQMVEAGIDDISWNADIKFEAVKKYYQQVDADILFYFSDIAIQAEAMGAKVCFSPDAMPSVEMPGSSVNVVPPATVPRMAVNAQVLKRMAKEFPDRTLSTMVYGPFTVAGQLAGEQELLRGIVERPGEVLDLMEKCLACARDYGRYLLDAGAEVFWISDPLAALLPPDSFWRFAGEFLARLYDIHPTEPTVLHICGDTSQILKDMVKTGVRAISFDQCMDLLAYEDIVPKSVGIVGNIDPVEIIELAPPEEVAASTKDLVATMGVKDNFILSTGCALPPGTPIANVVRFIETGKRALSELTPHAQTLSRLSDAVHRGKRETVSALVSTSLKEETDPLMIVNSALMRAVRKGSACYESRQSFLPEILLMVDAFYQGFRTLEPHLGAAGDRPPQVILGTVKGDFHEIGKNLVRIILETNGVKVLDLGVNVPAGDFLAAVNTYEAPVVGLSAFITGARKQLVEIVNNFNRSDVRPVSIIVGGAAVNPQIAASIGTQGYARDAVGAVKLVKDILGKTNG